MPKQDNPLKQHKLFHILRKNQISILQNKNSGSHHFQLVGYDKSGEVQTIRIIERDEYDRNWVREIRERFGLSPEEFYK